MLLVDTDPEQRAAYTNALTTVADHVSAVGTFAQARSVLLRVRPDVLVTQVRLGEFNGIHLALWGRTQLPHLRGVIIGQSDPSLEADAQASGFAYLRHNDAQAVVEATFEALSREQPRRRWRRQRLSSSLSARIDGSPAQVLDVGYGGFRARMEAPFNVTPDTECVLDIEDLGLHAEAHCRWVAPVQDSSGAYWCGAAVGDAAVRAGSTWRAFVDTVRSTS